MKKCSGECQPCCDFCKSAVHEIASDGDNLEPVACVLHRDYAHQQIAKGCGYCDDFECFNVPPTNADRIRGMVDKDLSQFSLLKTPFCLSDLDDDIPERCEQFLDCYACKLDWLQQLVREEV